MARQVVLVAEDNDVNRVVARALLEKRGFDTEVACDGREAIEMARAGGYSAIFMDCAMPNVDGYEAARQIREAEREATEPVPIIAVTAHTGEEDRQRCLAAGMDDFIAKPIRTDHLDEVIRFWLSDVPAGGSRRRRRRTS
jgi:CheY-like chemotaxis protein